MNMNIVLDEAYCPHCWNEVSKSDTTCCQCGEEISGGSSDDVEELSFKWALTLFVVSGIGWTVLLSHALRYY